jgi:ATP phosphoribosyltransferase
MFIRDTTHNGLRIISTGVPSAINGISSTGTTLETIHLLPCLQAILSQTSIFLVCATNTFTCLNTQVGKLSQDSLFKM